MIKLNSAGELEWEKSYGGSGDENAWNIILPNEGGFLFTGMTESDDGDVSNNYGSSDHWLVQLDNLGNLVWERSFGGSLNDRAIETIQTADGNLFVTGFSHSSDGDVSSNNGNADYWVYKLFNPTSIVSQPLNTFDFTIFPNPSGGNFQINVTNSTESVTVEIYTLFGQLIFKQKDITSLIELSNIVKGYYFVKLLNDNKRVTKPLIIH